MKPNWAVIVGLLFVLIFGARAISAEKHEKIYYPFPVPYIDKGGYLPCESCRLGKWGVYHLPEGEELKLYASPGSTRVVAKVRNREIVTGLGTEIRTMPGIIQVFQEHGEYRPRDIVYLLNYTGNGCFKVWFDGAIKSDCTIYTLALDTPQADWGDLVHNPWSVWWLHVQLKNGLKGWARETPDQPLHFNFTCCQNM